MPFNINNIKNKIDGLIFLFNNLYPIKYVIKIIRIPNSINRKYSKYGVKKSILKQTKK